MDNPESLSTYRFSAENMCLTNSPKSTIAIRPSIDLQSRSTTLPQLVKPLSTLPIRIAQ